MFGRLLNCLTNSSAAVEGVRCKIRRKTMNEQYWLVGATWGGTEDVLPKFIKCGYWYCWDPNQFKNDETDVSDAVKKQWNLIKQIKPGDRIAVKRLLGKGKTEMAILAIGIVKCVDLGELRVYVDWVLTDIKGRNVLLKGCLASIHGPFLNNGSSATWVQEVFCL